MQLREQDATRLRALSDAEITAGRVISLYLDLDPGTFGTQPARRSEIRSVLDELGRRVDAVADELEHAIVVGLREDQVRIEEYFAREFRAEGMHGLALFACGPAGIWEVFPLPHRVSRQVVVDAGPHLGPLAARTEDGTWGVLVVSRTRGRLLRGDRDGLAETLEREDDVHGRHDQGGWSQANYQRSIDRDAEEHVAGVLEEAFREFEREPFDHLLVFAPAEQCAAVEHHMHSYLQRTLAACVQVDLEKASPEEILAAARPEMERVEVEHEKELFERLAHRLAKGSRAAAGPQPTFDALQQGRVEVLLLLDGFATPGVVCPACGWMSTDPEVAQCPIDGTDVTRREDVVDAAVDAALAQDAAVLRVPSRVVPEDPGSSPSPRHLELQGHGGMAALLRF